jgi:cytochrome oxidase Cu insertion factor (SCO1/SenC/PrrC family)
MTPLPDAERAQTTRRARRTLLLIAAVGVAPVVASYAAYYFWPRETQVNYGALLPTRPAPDIEGARGDGRPFKLTDLRGKWVLVIAAAGACGAACDRMLYATRQARTIQGREMDRVVRLWLVTDEAPLPPALATQHPDLDVVRVTPQIAAHLPSEGTRIYLIDPRSNLVLAWPADPDIKALAKDLERLLRASQIG